MNKYLPSKQFIARIIIILIIALLGWGIYQIPRLFRKNKNANIAPTTLQVKDLIQKDSNNNGIADWEEGLWGLDPTTNGPSNKEFILAKRLALAKDNANVVENGGVATSENDTLSREVFALILSLQQSGSLNAESMKSISESVGQNIEPKDIPDIYTKDMIKIGGTESEYYIAFKNLVEKYQDKNMGSELSYVAQGLENKDPQALYAAKTVAVFYREMGQALIKIPTPVSLATTNLSLANNYEKVAQTIEGFSNVLNDQIAGMRSLINYKKYSDKIVADITKLSDNLN
jgi:hypothetical protein